MRCLSAALAVTPWSAASAATVPVWRSSMIENHHFVVPFHLDGAVVTVTPDAVLSIPAIPGAFAGSPLEMINREIWATSQLASYRATGLGLGEVTIRDRVKGVPAVVNEKAWIGVAFFNTGEIQCPVETSPPPNVVVPHWSGWAMVVMGMNPRAPVVVYVARREVCDRIGPASLGNARTRYSVPWRIEGAGPRVVATLASCSSNYGVAIGGSVPGPSTMSIYADRLDDLALAHCSPARSVVLPVSQAMAYSSRATLHGPVGLVRQVVTP